MASFDGHHRVVHPAASDAEAWTPVHCPTCQRDISAAVVARTQGFDVRWLQCPQCGAGAVFNGMTLAPAAALGPELAGLPDDVAEAYDEARWALGVDARAATELVCRQILLHVAVDQGAKARSTFAEAIDYLAGKGFVTPPMRPWVEVIRVHGNEVTHELVRPSAERAVSTLMFTAELLRLTYTMAFLSAQYRPAAAMASDGPSD